MKRILIIMLLSVLCTHLFAQTMEFKNNSGAKVLFVDGKKFTGNRGEIWKLEKNLAPQPVSSELVLLSTMGSTTTDVWKYFLLRFIDDQWEYITSFPGGLAPIVTLANAEFKAFQREEDTGLNKNYLIQPVTLTSYPAQKSWILLQQN